MSNKFISILEKANVVLPKAYLDFLLNKDFKSEVIIFPERFAFNLYKLDELCKKLSFDGNYFLTINELRGHVKLLREFEDKLLPNPKELSLSELSECLAIGYENTDLLFIDPHDHNSLWIFYGDGTGDIEKISMTLEKLILLNRT